MGNHWVRQRIDYGELVDAANRDPQDLFLVEVREWHSADDQTWEQVPTEWQLYTSGTTNPIDWYGECRGCRELSDVLRQGRWAISEWIEPTRTVERWSVDSARIRREFAAETMPDGIEVMPE